MIVAGGGAVLSGAGDEITRIAEILNIPVATTINGKGSINEMHAWSAGVIGGNGGRPYANQLLAEADCIFYLGTKVNSLITLKGTIPAPGRSVTVLQLDVDPNELGNNVPTAIAACGDLKESLAALLEIAGGCNTTAPSRQWSVQALAERAATYWAEVAERSACNDVPIAPQRVIDALWRHTPRAHRSHAAAQSGHRCRLIAPLPQPSRSLRAPPVPVQTTGAMARWYCTRPRSLRARRETLSDRHRPQ